MEISVIIPSYNREHFLGSTIESVLAQTVLPREIVVIDDGSTDDTASVVASFAERAGGRVRYYLRENGGLSAARNTGTRVATPECDGLLFLDSDDLLEPTALAKLGSALDADRNAPLAFCRARYINEHGRRLIVPNTALVDVPADGDMWKHLLSGNCIRSAGGVLLRRPALEAAGPFDETMRSNEDWDMWLRIAQSYKRFACVPEPLLLYRIHGANMSGNREVMRKTGLRVYEKQREQYAGEPERIHHIELGREEYLARDAFREGEAPQHTLASETLTDIPYDQNAASKHRKIRALIERAGIAALYRKTPMAWRLRLRTLFGIDPNA